MVKSYIHFALLWTFVFCQENNVCNKYKNVIERQAISFAQQALDNLTFPEGKFQISDITTFLTGRYNYPTVDRSVPIDLYFIKYDITKAINTTHSYLRNCRAAILTSLMSSNTLFDNAVCENLTTVANSVSVSCLYQKYNNSGKECNNPVVKPEFVNLACGEVVSYNGDCAPTYQLKKIHVFVHSTAEAVPEYFIDTMDVLYSMMDASNCSNIVVCHLRGVQTNKLLGVTETVCAPMDPVSLGPWFSFLQ